MSAPSHFTSACLTSLFLILVVVSAPPAAAAAAKATVGKQASREASYYPYQLVDHVGNDKSPYRGQMWSQRFYSMGTYFGGPGFPIFVYLGGEGEIEPERSLHHYPFITEHIARLFQAFIVEPEHRFYGQSQPISRHEIDRARNEGLTDPRLALLTSEQALHDYIRLTRAIRDQLSCSRDRFSDRYCPVITVGGSYPGWLSAMARLLFPSFVDISYASSAPMKFYAQQVANPNAYYDHITRTTDKAFPGCAAAVRKVLNDVVSYFTSAGPDSYRIEYSKIGICPGTLPEYYIQDTPTFLNEVVMMAGYTFANLNMAFYPPSSSSSSRLGLACETFLSSAASEHHPTSSSLETMAKFFVDALGSYVPLCFNMSAQLPTGPNATISSGDWSGVGTGPSGESWDFQTCTLLVEAIGFGNASMFPPREWTMAWMTRHCQARFGVGATPRPYELVQKWGIDDVVKAGATNILFTNGLVDGWSVSGIQQNLSDTVLALNFPNGSHHSDLSYYEGEDDNATDDIKLGRAQIRTILATWLQDLPGGKMSRVVPGRGA